MSHGPHAPILEAGLSPDCHRCRELAERPWLLDAENIVRLNFGHCYSDLDRQAEAGIAQILAQAAHIEAAVGA